MVYRRGACLSVCPRPHEGGGEFVHRRARNATWDAAYASGCRELHVVWMRVCYVMLCYEYSYVMFLMSSRLSRPPRPPTTDASVLRDGPPALGHPWPVLYLYQTFLAQPAIGTAQHGTCAARMHRTELLEDVRQRAGDERTKDRGTPAIAHRETPQSRPPSYGAWPPRVTAP